MFHILICDDNNIFVKYIERIILHSGVKREEVIFYEYLSGEELLQGIKEIEVCDLLIQDVQLTGIDGNKTAAGFRKKFRDVVLVFCSGLSPTDESFKTEPYRYLLKSYSHEKMISEMKAVVNEVKRSRMVHYIVGHYYYNTILLRPEDILYIENDRHGSLIHICKDREMLCSDKKVTAKQKLNECYKLLKPYGFVFAHNSYIVNMNYIVKVQSDGEIELADKTLLNISRSRLKEFRVAFAEWISKQYP